MSNEKSDCEQRRRLRMAFEQLEKALFSGTIEDYAFSRLELDQAIQEPLHAMTARYRTVRLKGK